MTESDAFIRAACVPREAHASGTLDAADAILAAHPEVAQGDIYVAAVLGDGDRVRRLLAEDGTLATAGLLRARASARGDVRERAVRRRRRRPTMAS